MQSWKVKNKRERVGEKYQKKEEKVTEEERATGMRKMKKTGNRENSEK